MQKLCPKSLNGANSPSFYSSPPITTFDHTQMSLLPVPKFQPASGKPLPRAGVIKYLTECLHLAVSLLRGDTILKSKVAWPTTRKSLKIRHSGTSNLDFSPSCSNPTTPSQSSAAQPKPKSNNATKYGPPRLSPLTNPPAATKSSPTNKATPATSKSTSRPLYPIPD